MPPAPRTLRASTAPLAAVIVPRSIRSCSSTRRALCGFSRSEEASKTVQREVNATSSANSTATSPNRRTIGRFTAPASFELFQFEAADQRGGVAFGAQRVIEQLVSFFGSERRGAD